MCHSIHQPHFFSASLWVPWTWSLPSQHDGPSRLVPPEGIPLCLLLTLPPSLRYMLALPWGWCGNDATNIIKHFVKLCTETEGNSIILLNDVNGSYHLISALPCRQMTTAWSHGFIKSNASTLPSKCSKPALWLPIISWYFEIDWNCHSRAVTLHSQRKYNKLSTGH